MPLPAVSTPQIFVFASLNHMISATQCDRLCLMMSSEIQQFVIGTLLFKEWPTVSESGNAKCLSSEVTFRLSAV